MTFKRILVPTDLSPDSMAALRYAEAMADTQGAHLVLAHFRPTEDGVRRSREHLVDLLRGRASTVESEVIVEVGDPLAHILDFADRRQVELIVMGTQGRSGLRRALMGSVAEAVVRRAPCSVMTVRYPEASSERSSVAPGRAGGDDATPPGSGPPRLSRVLVPLDFSSASLEALRVAAALPAHTVQLLHVIDDPAYLYGPFMAPLDITEVARQEVDRVRDLLRDLARRHLGAVGHVELVGHGEAGPTILEAARQYDSDLIVMTTHGRTGIARFLMGSTAERVARGAPCPVLTVRGTSALALQPELVEQPTSSTVD
jgi:nucleotide-binding universal stress UspA family protein